MGVLNFLVHMLRRSPDFPTKSASDIREALLAVNSWTHPFVVRDGGPESVDLVAEWQIDDSYWREVFNRAQISETFRILMRLDAVRHEVCASEEAWTVKWQAGAPSLSLRPGAFHWQSENSYGPGISVNGIPFDWLDYDGPASKKPFAFTESRVKIPLQKAINGTQWAWCSVPRREP
jgi:hypothetical protein